MVDRAQYEGVWRQHSETRPGYTGLVHQYCVDHVADVATLDALTAHLRDHEAVETDGIDVQVRLHHVTLPKLAENGVIEYDPRSHTARYRGETPPRTETTTGVGSR